MLHRLAMEAPRSKRRCAGDSSQQSAAPAEDPRHLQKRKKRLDQVIQAFSSRRYREAPPGFEPGMADLQSAALGLLATAPFERVIECYWREIGSSRALP